MYTGPEKYRADLHIANKIAYLLLGFIMTFVTLWPKSAGAIATGDTAHQFGSLIFLMAIFSPVCHMHYLLFCMPIVMSILSHTWQFQPTIRIPGRLMVLFTAFNVAMVIAYWPELEFLRDLCIAMFAALPLWVIPVVQMWRSSATPCVVPTQQELPKAA